MTVYERHRDAQPTCRWKIEDPSQHINTVIVYKKPDPDLWNRVSEAWFGFSIRLSSVGVIGMNVFV